MKSIFSLFSAGMLLILLLSFFSCRKNAATAPAAPVIASFTPASGSVGKTVTITGTGFSPSPAQNIVTFANNINATVTVATATQLTVKVPAGAVTGAISLTVGSGPAAVSASAFTVLPPGPSISSFSPAFGLPGDVVVISGTGFSPTASQNTVTFSNGVTASVSSTASSQITVTVPAGAVSGTLSVTVNGQTAVSDSSFEMLTDIPRGGLVAYYPLDGDGNDASGHVFNLNLTGDYSAVANRFGISNHAIYFGTGYSFERNAADVQVTQPLTISFWTRYNALTSGSIIAKNVISGGSLSGYSLSFDISGSVQFEIDGASSVFFTNAGTLPASSAAWMFIALTYDGNTFNLYKDGAVVYSANRAGTITATGGNLFIGHGGAFSMDDVTIYNRVLSAVELQQLYHATISKR